MPTKPIHELFEGREPQGGFWKLTYSMTRSPAWQDLTLRQRGLYMELKMRLEYMGKSEREHGGHNTVYANRDGITFPISQWHKLYKRNYRAFKQDIDALMDHGFIRKTRSGYASRDSDFYGFWADWIRWRPL